MPPPSSRSSTGIRPNRPCCSTRASSTAGRDDAKAKLDELDGKSASPRLSLDMAEFDAKLDDAKAKLVAFKAESALVSLGASGGGSGGGGGGGGGGEGGGPV